MATCPEARVGPGDPAPFGGVVVPPADVGATAEGLAKLEAKVRHHVEAKHLPGLQILCAKSGKVFCNYSYGWADEARQLALDQSVICRMYSTTKPIVYAIAAALVHEGKMALDDPVSKHVPEWRDTLVRVCVDNNAETTEPAKTPVTIRHLFTHTSGLDYGFWPDAISPVSKLIRKYNLDIPHSIEGDESAEHPAPESLAEFVTRLVRDIPLAFQPGTRFQYGASTDVMGRVLECLTGKGLGEVVQDYISGPLGMGDTAFGIPAEKLSRFSTCSTVPGAGIITVAKAGEGPDAGAGPGFVRAPGHIAAVDETTPWLAGARQEKCPSAGGGLLSTLQDYSKFAEMVTANGEVDGKRILPAEALDMMREEQLAIIGAERTNLSAFFQGVGLGVSVVTKSGVKGTYPGGATAGVGTGGWGGAAQTFYFADPKNHVTFVLMGQLLNYSASIPALRAEFSEMVYQCFPDIYQTGEGGGGQHAAGFTG